MTRVRVLRLSQSFLSENGLVFTICALEIGDFVGALEVPYSGRDFIYQILVMRDQQYCSGIALQRNVEGVDRFEIQMVGRLVEHEQVRLLQHQFAKEQPRRFSAGEDVGTFVGIVAREQHLAEYAANLFSRSGRIPLMEPLQNLDAGLD